MNDLPSGVKAPLRVYVGWDPIDDLASRVCAASLSWHASIPLDIRRIWDRPLRDAGLYWREYQCLGGRRDDTFNGQMIDLQDGRQFSTAFSFARFGVVLLERDNPGPVVFCDPDMLWRCDIAQLIADADPQMAVSVVKHRHAPAEATKMLGQSQRVYDRKNWSSLMVIRPRLCTFTPYQLNNWSGQELHGFCWLPDELIGGLEEWWNWLEGWSSPHIDPAVVHYTRGTPDMKGFEDAAFAAEWRDYADAVQPTWP